MRKWLICWVGLLCFAAAQVSAQQAGQGFSGLARVDPQASRLIDSGSGATLDLALSQGVPFRLFTLADPPRVVLDFREVDWRGLDKAAFDRADMISDVRFGGFRPGWSRMVLELAQPMRVGKSDMRIDEDTGAAHLRVTLDRVDAAGFAATAILPGDPEWGVPSVRPPRKPGKDRLTIVLDPGHGGIDPGAERDGLNEKELMLLFAFELRDALLRNDGIDVVLTREEDVFVSLERRVALAHRAGADIFVSLHADMLTEGRAHGAVAYTLSDQASDEASRLLAERHDRDDILSGVDLTGRDDVVADVLLDLARLETRPRSLALAKHIADGLKQAKVPLNRHPHREAAFSVLKAADIPSVLLEIAFLSSDRDLANVSDPAWRARAAIGLANGIRAWQIEDEALRALVRQ
ncbi:N-acetylmuramoyl-L-alanine amidase [Rhodalgimonas zhirmunskyi]|uniref:N-acetylmuramoyl-L-alanine amidase n=1 Tax=Rhodalgimonas zhirmunskyi TaxID=2964767 RepID=A0AAJ1U2L4_9RHOB|nr:N-acetylmuramoyl-L-alanine amidase [Rhodoalgimonas zhirmunskyi]MDQ2092551.1 N-acetylmuramoyl-L-alanine amidase [Rhodoalgimonas zhirmunskyi]